MDARLELEAVYLPPAAQGDVYRASQRRPQAIAIVDGYFERVPAVWHKEILWAMSRGIHVFGSASMGALRASELETFGMEGVGAVFESYRDGALEDDDEVSIAHGPEEIGYAGQSDAMINIRFTLRAAEACGVISHATATALTAIAKDTFYPERSYALTLRLGAERGLPREELQSLTNWLPEGKVNQKREDAIAMLRLMRERLEGGLEPKRVVFSFEHTSFWEEAKASASQIPLDSSELSNDVDLDLILDELRLEGWYEHARLASVGRYLGIEYARRHGMRVRADSLRQMAETFRREQDLLDASDAERWLQQNGLDNDHALRLMEDEALVRWTRGSVGHQATEYLADHLRMTGDYARLRERARAKQRALQARGTHNPGLADAGMTEEELFRWFLGRAGETGAARAMADRIQRMSFDGKDSFRRAVLREFCYLQVESEGT